MKKGRIFRSTNRYNIIIALATITIFSMLFSSSLKFSKEVIDGRNIPANAGLVTSADVIIRDGAAPFDSNDNPGNDSNDHNNIVRSNDKLVYEIKPYVNLTNSSSTNIIIKGTLPKKNLIYWHKEEIDKFAKGYIRYSQDSKNYYFTYERNYSELTAEKGSSTISLYFDVLVSGAKNNELIEPTFEIYMSGNNEGQKKMLKPKAVRVSSVNRTKIELGQGGNRQEKVTYNGKVGRMYATSVYVKMENDPNKKGLIGLEYPQEDILSDIELKTFLNPKNGGIAGQKKEFTGDLRPEVMQYCLNSQSDFKMKIKENENFPYYYIADTSLPETKLLKRVYDGVLTFVNKDNYITSGDIQVSNITKGSATVRFFNYLLDEKNIFPVGGIWSNKRDYPETDGYITAANIVVFCPFPVEQYIQEFLNEKGSSISPEDFDYTVDLEVTLKNKRIKENNQEMPVYGESSRTYICNKVESPKDKSIVNIYEEKEKKALPESESDRFDGRFRVVDTFKVRNSVTKFYTQDDEYKTYGTALFLKFDGDLIEPTGNIIRKFNINKIYYLTKKDGRNWTSETEMKNARYDAFNYYETVEEAKKHGTVVGIAGQGVKPEESGILLGNIINYYYAEFKTKENVKPGTVGLFSNMSYNYFKRDENQDGGNFLDGTFKPPSEKEGYLVLEEYQYKEKTKYDSEGNNTNKGNPASYLILNAMPEIKIETNRNVYNLISNQNVVNVSIVPSIKTSVRASKTEKKKVRTEITIPKGLEFDEETVKIGGESAKPISVISEGDNTKVIFEYETTYDEKDYASKVITFSSKIDRSLRNNTYLKMNALTKIEGEAPSYITERQASKSINVQNSLAEVAYQNIKRRVIEYGENFNFEIAMLNNSRNSHQEVTLFNILPYNTGDSASSDSYFDGTYNISNLKSSLNADIYYTTDEKIRNYNAKNYNEAGVTWNRYTGGTIENVKAIYSKSSINAYSEHKITFDILPVGQKVTNTYINDFSTHIKGQGGILQVREKVAIAKRNIYGKLWEDKNVDGKITEGESNIKNITLSLRQENGQKVTRLDGTVVEDVVTSENGDYAFEDVPPIKNLKVVMHKNDNMQSTKKGLDNVANDNFEITNISPLPAIDMNKDETTLNYIQNLTKYNIGIVYKKDVQVKKIWKNGSNRPEIEIVLYRNIQGGKKQEVKRQKITTNANSNETSYTFDNLETIDESDNIYTYSADEINVPKNYTKEISKDGLTITNTYNIPKMDLDIKKVWKNGNNRPDVEVVLYRNIEGGKKEEVEKVILETPKGSDEVTHTFNSLDKTDIAGNEYTYTIDEITNVENYIKEIDNEKFQITNTYNIPKKDIPIKKLWKNGKARPDVEVVLYRNIKGAKKEEVEKVTLKTPEGSNEVTHNFNSLDKTDIAGNEYTYTIDEITNVENYIKDVDNEKMQITNTYNIPKKDIPIKKLWKNGKARPDVEVVLYRNIKGAKKEEVEKVTLKTPEGSNEVTHNFNSLDKTDIAGNEYTYTIDEITNVENYTKEIDNEKFQITNTYNVPKKDITGKVVWVNGKKREDLTLILYRKDNSGKEEEVDRKVVSTEKGKNETTYTWNNIDRTDISGNEYTYRVDEERVPENYSKKISQDGLTITNSYVIPKENKTIKKVWKNGKARPDVEVVLYRNIEGGNKEEVEKVILKTPKGSNEVTHTFNSLDKTDIAGHEYTYTIDEITNVENYTKEIDNENYVITNTYNIPKKDIPIKKLWKNGKARPDVEVVLYRNIEGGNKEEVEKVTLETPKGSNEVTHTFNSVDKTDIAGNEYTYTIDEITNVENYIKDVDNEKMQITNTYNIPKKDIPIKKLWKNGKARPDVEVVLYRNIEGGKKEEVEKVTVKTDEGTDEATHVFSDMDKTDISGNEYTYSIDEVNAPTNYNKKIVDNNTILNEYVSPKKDLKITKKWIGGSSRQDINVILYRHVVGEEKHKEKVQEQIVKTKEGTNESTYTFTNLDKTDKNANEYIYTIDEASVPLNYTKEMDNENYIITNTYVSPKREFSVTKKWIGGKKREDIQIQLYRNGEKYLEPITLKTDEGTDEAKYTFSNLDKTDKNANDYIYTVDEVTTPTNFVKSLNTDDSSSNTITNTYISPKIDIAATKKWVGGENVRPDTITFALYRKIEGGRKEKVTEEEIKVTKENELTHIFTKQDKTDKNGNVYIYSVEEINVPANYSKEETGLVVVNTYSSPKIDVPVSMIYVNGKLKRKDVKIELLRNGNKIDEVEFKVEDQNTEEKNQEKEKDKYEHIFKDLEKTDKSGKDYNYEIRQVTDVKYFVKKEQGLSVVNEYVIPKIDISFAKKWVGALENKEKPEIEVQLYKEGKKYLDVVSLKDGNTSYTWGKQDRTDKDGKEYSYEIKEELVPKYYNEKTALKNDSEDKKEFEITNTFNMPKVNAKGNIIWKDGPDNNPDVEMELLANDKKVDKIVLEDGKTDFEFKNLDIFDKYGKEIKYSIAQNILTEKYTRKNNIKYDLRYDSSIDSKEVLDIEKDREFEITNTYIVPKTEIKAKKTWINAEGNKPNISLTLYKDGKRFKEQVLESGKSECIFEDLDRTDEKGNEYTYIIDEEKVPEGYIKKKSKEGNTIVNIRDKKDEELPYAGTKGNNPLKLSLIILAVLLIKLRRDKKRVYNIGI